MGYKLANAAYETSATLAGIISDRARLTLDHMCRSARDTPNREQRAGIYYGGYNAIAMHLMGLEKGGTEAGNKAAQRAVRELVDHGLIKLVRKSGPGRTAEYQILIGGDLNDSEPVENSPQPKLLDTPT